MGSTISNIADKIKEHGSWEAYQEYLSNLGFMKIETDLCLEQRTVKHYAMFKDSDGAEVTDGSIIKIINHLGNSDLNGSTGIVKWHSLLGRYEYQLDCESESLRAFDLVNSFVVIR